MNALMLIKSAKYAYKLLIHANNIFILTVKILMRQY